MLQFLLTYKNPILHTSLSLSLTFLLSFFKIPSLFLHGLHTYIQPENLHQDATRAAIRRPESSNPSSTVQGYQQLSSKPNIESRKRSKSKEKSEFDENNAQIFRITLDHSRIQSRLYFHEYRRLLILSLVCLSSLLLQFYLGVSESSESFINGTFVPLLFGFILLCNLVLLLAKVSFEKSASRKSEKQLSVLLGVLGFTLGLLICFEIVPRLLDFRFGSINGVLKVFLAVLMGFIAGFLLMPALKNARSFWLGTDQLRSNLSMIHCGWFSRVILYANTSLSMLTVLLWINPFVEILFNKSINDAKGAHLVSEIGDAKRLIGNVGMSLSDFNKLRVWCLLLLGLLQIVALRPNLQMYLNEALLSWYQRLHASKIPDLDFSRAKVFLHNHYLCLVVLQFLAPPILVLLFVGLSQIDGNFFLNSQPICSLQPCSSIVKEVALFLAWWVVFVWAAFSSGSLVLYRRGILYMS